MEPHFNDITIERQAASGNSSEYHLIGVLGGSVSGLVEDLSSRRSTHHGLTWRENALVFENGTHTAQGFDNDVWTERTETWSLSADGHLLVVISTSNASKEEQVVTLRYRRR